MHCLISTEPSDTHAVLVKLALESLGHQVTLLFMADQPTQQKNSVFIDKTEYRWKSSDRYDVILENEYDVVWWRRARKPYVPKKITHPDDYRFVDRENRLFYESFTHNLAPTAWWINSKEAANRANFKLLQLKIASECGMKIPTTLCSNDPMEIRRFFVKYQEDGVIYKPLCTYFWLESESIKVTYTTRIEIDDLPDYQTLQSAPSLFQKEIKKKYELRVTCFGHYMVAAKLNSQAHPTGEVDWRAMQNGLLSVEPYDLPPDLQDKIRMFMYALGLVFGSFDFIVTEDNDYIFLEVNEQGQFLWIEHINPSFSLLDIFVQFLLNRSVDFTWNAHQKQHTVANYQHRMATIISENKERHIDLTAIIVDYEEKEACR